jgi:AAA family ATP:ADP antiporter
MLRRTLAREVEGRTVSERFLSLFADVRAGEGRVALLLALDIFLILTAYYVLKVVREPLILTGGAFGLRGATLKSAAAAGQALLLLGVVPAYGALARRVDRLRLVNLVTLIFVGILAVFGGLAACGAPIGLPFFVWLGIFNVMVVAQFWSFANDLYTPDQGQRLFGVVAFGGTAGAIAGAALGTFLLTHLGAVPPMLVAAGLLGAAMLLSNVIHRLATGRAPAAPPLRAAGGFRLVLGRPYLLGIALLILVYNTVNSNGEFILGQSVVEQAARLGGTAAEQGRIIGAFYGGYFTAVTLLSAFLQLFVVSRVLSRFGVQRALLVLPAIALGSYGIIAALPILGLIRGGKVLENSVDYSLQSTTRQALFLPTSPDEKYKAKTAIDTFFVRFGDVLSLALVALATVLGLGAAAMAIINLGLVGVWLVLAVAVGRENRRLVAQRA